MLIRSVVIGLGEPHPRGILLRTNGRVPPSKKPAVLMEIVQRSNLFGPSNPAETQTCEIPRTIAPQGASLYLDHRTVF